MTMPIDGTNYVKPTWINEHSPAINASELNDMSGALEKALTSMGNQDLTVEERDNARANLGISYGTSLPQSGEEGDIFFLIQS